MECTYSTEDMKGLVGDYLLRPTSLSKGQKTRLRDGFNSGDNKLINREVGNILSDIRATDSELATRLISFTPHDSCQISLIREVLLETWNTGKLNTKPIPMIGARPSSRLLPSEAMA